MCKLQFLKTSTSLKLDLDFQNGVSLRLSFSLSLTLPKSSGLFTLESQKVLKFRKPEF